MTGFDDLNESLQAMSFIQLLLAFTALMSYAFAQGRLLSARGRGWAWALAVFSAVGFCTQADAWEHGALLAALAVVTIGLFAAVVWSVSRLLGVDRGGAASASAFGDAPEAEVAALAVLPMVAAPAEAPARAAAPRAEPVHST